MHDQLVNTASKSEHGRGGMAAKIGAAWMAAEHGCTTVILNGKKPDGILQVYQLSARLRLRLVLGFRVMVRFYSPVAVRLCCHWAKTCNRVPGSDIHFQECQSHVMSHIFRLSLLAT